MDLLVHFPTPTKDIKYALFLCDWAQDIWANIEMNHLTNQAVDISIEDVLCATHERQEGKFELMLMAIQVALAKGFASVALETDSSILVEAFKHDQVLGSH
ncbi:hypothetical protein Tco_1082272 [Tanacetum coccineum]|uniref:RNase H type-1 domain-containing protein n=1 Tax=Tanacetum coccineum TaxID=301880 RepID=A0ABQ5I222_9ASTR